MLKKLGRRLTLMNFLISGAILIVMTVVSLSVTEGVMVTQYEADLNKYAASLVSVMYRMPLAYNVRLQMPENYIVYTEDKERLQMIITQDTIEEGALKQLAEEIKTTIAEEQAGRVTRSISIAKSLNTDGESAPQAIYVEGTSESVAYVLSDYRHSAIEGVEYRIAVFQLYSQAQQSMVMVLQDRTEELNSRDQLRIMFSACVAGGLFLIVLASLYLSSRSIRPVEESILKQQEFVAAASHELRTPVAAIRANAEVLTDAELGELYPFLQSIRDESVRMSRLVDDLMSLARADAGQLMIDMGPIDVAEVAGEVVQLIRPVAKGRDLQVQSDLHSALIIGDSERLRQVLLSLLDNAMRYTPSGGTILVSTAKEGHNVYLRVEDTGIGIADEHKTRIFERFYCVDAARTNASGGAGLGLSVAKQFVDLMKGRIEVLDGPNGGSVFMLTFSAAVGR